MKVTSNSVFFREGENSVRSVSFFSAFVKHCIGMHCNDSFTIQNSETHPHSPFSSLEKWTQPVGDRMTALLLTTTTCWQGFWWSPLFRLAWWQPEFLTGMSLPSIPDPAGREDTRNSGRHRNGFWDVFRGTRSVSQRMSMYCFCLLWKFFVVNNVRQWKWVLYFDSGA